MLCNAVEGAPVFGREVSASQVDALSGSRRQSRSPARARYRLEDFDVIGSPLGGGAFGQVSKVEHRRTGCVYAMKVVPKQRILEHNMTDYLAREVTTQITIRHPNILQLFYYFEDDESVHILLEFASGGSLFGQLKQRGRLPAADAARYFVHVGGALVHLHRKGIVHRDLKPENVLMCDGDVAKVADFGWCGELDSESERKTFCGTWDYLSPEMLQSEPHDHNVDVWAMGVLLFEMLTHRAPFAARTQMQALLRITNVDLQFPEYYSESARDLTSRLLRADPCQRMQLPDTFVHPFIAQFDCVPAVALGPLFPDAGTATPPSTSDVQAPLNSGPSDSHGSMGSGDVESQQRKLWQDLLQHVRGCWVDEKGDFYGGAWIEFSDEGWRPLNPKAPVHRLSAYSWKVRTHKCVLSETRRDGSKCQFEMALGRDGRMTVRYPDQKMQWKLRRVNTDGPKSVQDSLLCSALSASDSAPSAAPRSERASSTPMSEESARAVGGLDEEQPKRLSFWPWQTHPLLGGGGTESPTGDMPARHSWDGSALKGVASIGLFGEDEEDEPVKSGATAPPCLPSLDPDLPSSTAQLLQKLRASTPLWDDRPVEESGRSSCPANYVSESNDAEETSPLPGAMVAFLKLLKGSPDEDPVLQSLQERRSESTAWSERKSTPTAQEEGCFGFDPERRRRFRSDQQGLSPAKQGMRACSAEQLLRSPSKQSAFQQLEAEKLALRQRQEQIELQQQALVEAPAHTGTEQPS